MDFVSLFLAVAFSLTARTAYASTLITDAPPVLLAIAQAESGQRQFDAKGNLICDGVTHTHCGYFQIGKEWKKVAAPMGIDIDTQQGNITFALILYKRYGTAPWKASEFDKTNPNSWGRFYNSDGTPKLGSS